MESRHSFVDTLTGKIRALTAGPSAAARATLYEEISANFSLFSQLHDIIGGAAGWRVVRAACTDEATGTNNASACLALFNGEQSLAHAAELVLDVDRTGVDKLTAFVYRSYLFDHYNAFVTLDLIVGGAAQWKKIASHVVRVLNNTYVIETTALQNLFKNVGLAGAAEALLGKVYTGKEFPHPPSPASIRLQLRMTVNPGGFYYNKTALANAPAFYLSADERAELTRKIKGLDG